MRWPWSHADTGQQLEDARADLERVRGQWPEVRTAARTMREWRERNHFAEAITATFRGEHR